MNAIVSRRPLLSAFSFPRKQHSSMNIFLHKLDLKYLFAGSVKPK